MSSLPADWKVYHAEQLAKIPEDKRNSAIAFLRTWFSDNVQALIREAHDKDPQTWWAGYHSFWGMGVRNALRTAGFGEAYLGVDNLDDVYVGLIEEAVIGNETSLPEPWTPGRKFI